MVNDEEVVKCPSMMFLSPIEAFMLLLESIKGTITFINFDTKFS